MATDIDAIIRNLENFYDFNDKSVIHVGAGGGQFIEYAARARSVLGVDPDQESVERLQSAVKEKGLADRFKVVTSDFASITAEGDVVFFEFCLHEIADPAAALSHAQSLAPEIVVIDHDPESQWAWYCCETEKAERSWREALKLPIVREASFPATQHFRDYSELASKVEVLGETSMSRIEDFAGQRDITIGMSYKIALLRAEKE